MVLVSFLLVLAAAVTLVAGLLQSGLTLIYVSIGCSVIAGIVLAVAVLRGRPEEAPAVTGLPAQGAAPPQTQPFQPAVQPEPVAAGTSRWGRPETAPPPPPASTPSPSAPVPEVKAAAATLATRLRRRRGQEPGDEMGAGDDTLGDDFEEEDEGEGEQEALTQQWNTAPDEAEDLVGVEDTYGDGAAEDVDAGDLPIEDYDRMRASEILSRLPELDRRELITVRDYEAANMNRFTVMSRIEAELARTAGGEAGDSGWEVEEADWDSGYEEPMAMPAATGSKRAAAKAPARKTTAKKSTVKKAAAKKAPAKAPARKTTAKKAPAKTASVKKAPAAKKAATKKAPAAKKAPAKKASRRA